MTPSRRSSFSCSRKTRGAQFGGLACRVEAVCAGARERLPNLVSGRATFSMLVCSFRLLTCRMHALRIMEGFLEPRRGSANKTNFAEGKKDIFEMETRTCKRVERLDVLGIVARNLEARCLVFGLDQSGE